MFQLSHPFHSKCQHVSILDKTWTPSKASEVSVFLLRPPPQTRWCNTWMFPKVLETVCSPPPPFHTFPSEIFLVCHPLEAVRHIRGCLEGSEVPVLLPLPGHTQQQLCNKLYLPQIHICTVTKLHSYTVTQIHSYTVTQLHSYTVTQLHSYTDTQWLSYTVIQLYSYTVTQIHSYTVTQLPRYN